MDLTQNRQLISSPKRQTLIHLAYWILVTIAFLFERSYLVQKVSLHSFVQCSVVRIALLVGVSYINSYWLMPSYMFRKKYVTYFILVAALVVSYIVAQSFYDYYLFGYVLGSKNPNLYIVLLGNSFNTVWYVALSVALKLSIDWYEQNQTLQKTKIEKLQAEINYLRAQVNPHFLFNVLNSLYSLTIKKSDLAPDVVLKLSEMMEYMLYESEETFVPLEKELTYLKNYLELEKIRQGNDADIVLNIQGDAGGKQIAPFMLLPLVENAFKHGVSKLVDKAWLHIHITIKNNDLSFTIENSRLSFHKKDKHSGIGLSNLKQRLELLYADKHILEIKETEDTFKLSLSVNLS